MVWTKDQVPALDSGRNPFEVFLLLLSIVTGVPLLLGHIPPGSTAALLNPLLLAFWASILVAGSVITLAGAFWSGRAHIGLLCEQFGLVITGVGMLIYTTGLVLTAQAQGRWVAAGLGAAFTLACWWRVWQIQRWVKAVVRLGRDLEP